MAPCTPELTVKVFASRDAKKTYWALTVGVPAIAEGEIDAPLSASRDDRGCPRRRATG